MWPLKDLSLAETFGLTDPKKRIHEVRMALGGDEYTPSSKFGLSSLGIYRPKLSVKTWLGWRPSDGLVPVSNLFNRTPTPTSEGWSVRKTQVTDFRGGRCTYDSHNGTDFAVPPASLVVAPASGVVRRISDEFHRGGLKVIIDHGHGLITTSNHLGRALVNVGDFVKRGDPIALSAYSGLDSVVAFPWSVPHVHFNTWLNGDPVDPFALDDEEALWIGRNAPAGATPTDGSDFEPTEWDPEALDRVIQGCIDPELRAELAAIEDLDTRAVDTIFMKNYFPTRFKTQAPIYAERFEREQLLGLPFSPEDVEGVRFLA